MLEKFPAFRELQEQAGEKSGDGKKYEGAHISKTDYYFAYGSNLNKEQMLNRCSGAEPVKKVILRGYKLDFCGVASISRQKNSVVPGAVYKITTSDEVALNRYEGFPTLYEKRSVEVCGLDDEVMFYFIRDKELSYPSYSYLRTVRKGYEDWGLDEKKLYEALDRSVTRDLKLG